MKVISLNVRGLGGLAKQKSLQNLFVSLSPNLILLQETMTSSYPALLDFSKLRPGWEFCVVSSSGLLGGILSAWNPHCIKLKYFHTVAGILLKARLRGSSFTLSFLNCYGPYSQRESFWDAVVQGGILNLPNLV